MARNPRIRARMLLVWTLSTTRESLGRNKAALLERKVTALLSPHAPPLAQRAAYRQASVVRMLRPPRRLTIDSLPAGTDQ